MLVVAACGSADPWPTRAEDLAAIGDPWLMLPPGASPFFVTLTADARPAWRVRAGEGAARVTTKISVPVAVPVVLLLRADEPTDFEVPAMRVRKTITTGAAVVAWFIPTTTGDFPILVSTRAGRYDGTIAVHAAGQPR